LGLEEKKGVVHGGLGKFVSPIRTRSSKKVSKEVETIVVKHVSKGPRALRG